MRVTALKETKAGRVALSLDGAYTASLDVLTVGEYGLCVGDEVDEETLREMMALSDSRRAKTRAIELLSYRDHSSAELKKKLLRHATEENADAAVERMEELGMVNDREFALRYAKELSEVKLYGEKRVKVELQRKGLSSEDMEAALMELPDQRELITRLLTGKLSRYAADPENRDKLRNRLLTRGFAWEDIRAVLREWEED